MITDIEDFYKGAEKYIESFNTFAKKHTLEGRALSDHICYKCESKESFENLRILMEANSHYMYQSIISKRRIAYIKFKTEIETVLGPINFLELSDQKPDGSQKEGFDHIEVYPTAMSYDEMVVELEKTEKVIKADRPHHITHDIDIGDAFTFRCTQGKLLDKIKTGEMT